MVVKRQGSELLFQDRSQIVSSVPETTVLFFSYLDQQATDGAVGNAMAPGSEDLSFWPPDPMPFGPPSNRLTGHIKGPCNGSKANSGFDECLQRFRMILEFVPLAHVPSPFLPSLRM